MPKATMTETLGQNFRRRLPDHMLSTMCIVLTSARSELNVCKAFSPYLHRTLSHDLMAIFHEYFRFQFSKSISRWLLAWKWTWHPYDITILVTALVYINRCFIQTFRRLSSSSRELSTQASDG